MDHAAPELPGLRVGQEELGDLRGQTERHQLGKWKELRADKEERESVVGK